MHRLVYLSVADDDLDWSGIGPILKVSQANNGRDGVTGLLLYDGGSFLQVLEGQREAVLTTFDRIRADPRHHDVKLMLSETVAAPAFEDWAMICQEVTSLADCRSMAERIDGHAGQVRDVVLRTMLTAYSTCRERYGVTVSPSSQTRP